MRAVVLDESAGLTLDASRPAPSPPPGEALIRPVLAGVCNTDLELAKGYMGFSGVLGHEFVGVVESAPSKQMTGKRVVGEINCPCGKCPLCKRGKGNHCPARTVLGILGRDGVFAEYFTLPEANLHIVPDNVPDRAAVFAEPLAAAFEILEQVSFNADTNVALLGDGKLGLLIGQVLLSTGCPVTAIGRHPDRLKPLAAKGATAMVEKVLDRAARLFDVVVDATGSPEGLAMAADIVRPCGTIVLKTTVANPPRFDVNRLVIDEITVVGSRCGPFGKAMAALAGGRIETEPLVSEIMGLNDGVEAMRRASAGGNLKVLLDIAR